VGTDEASSKLTSEFELNGLTFTRNSNEVTDAVDGVTMNLEEANGTESSFEVTADEEGAKGAVKEFIKRYNEVNNFLQNKTEVNPDSRLLMTGPSSGSSFSFATMPPDRSKAFRIV